MTARQLTDVTLAVRDAIYEGLLVRKGDVLTEELARERANNTCHRVIEALRDLATAKAAEVTGETAQEHAEHLVK